ncbi:MAG: GNAT family N-acetyltransferase [Paracoccaceae bacterium]|nr:GNAT family N-acetyltransferase [Paracoccaceae bacterium]
MLDVRELDRHDDGELFASADLARDVFPGLDDGRIDHVQADRPEGSILLGMFDGDRVVGIGRFLRHGVCRNGETAWAHQIRMIEIDRGHRDSGLFSQCMDWAIETLKTRGSAFLFAYPNAADQPIYMENGGFSLTPLVAVDIPTPMIRYLMGLYVDAAAHCDGQAAAKNLISFDAYETADWAETRHSSDLRGYEHYTNFIFGRAEARKVLGATLRIFSVRGYEINKPPLLGDLLARIAAEERAHLIRFIVPRNSPLAMAARFRRAVDDAPLIACPLNWTLDDCVLEAWAGLGDVH